MGITSTDNTASSVGTGSGKGWGRWAPTAAVKSLLRSSRVRPAVSIIAKHDDTPPPQERSLRRQHRASDPCISSAGRSAMAASDSSSKSSRNSADGSGPGPSRPRRLSDGSLGETMAKFNFRDIKSGAQMTGGGSIGAKGPQPPETVAFSLKPLSSTGALLHEQLQKHQFRDASCHGPQMTANGQGTRKGSRDLARKNSRDLALVTVTPSMQNRRESRHSDPLLHETIEKFSHRAYVKGPQISPGGQTRPLHLPML